MKTRIILLIFTMLLIAGKSYGVNPQGSLSANGPFCTSGAGQLTWTATAGVSPFTIVYNDGVADRTVINVVSGVPFDVAVTPVTSTTTYVVKSVTGADADSKTSGFTDGSATITIHPLPLASAGGNITICQNGTATVSGASATNGTIAWTENGSGTITSGSTTLTPTYTAAAGDAGLTVTLTMTVTSTNSCSPATATATFSVSVNALPTAVAGGSQTICVNGTATVSGATSSNGTIFWTDNGAGSITSGETTLTPTYTPAAGDAGNTVTLTMTVSNSPCSNALATYSVVVDALPIATAGGSQTICQNGTATVSGASATNGTIAWIENGAGTITLGATTLTPTYTAAAGDAGNTVTLTMTVTSSNTCTPSTQTATYTVIVEALPTASAGGSQTICQNGTATVSGASATNGTIAWTENGSGTITSGSTTLTPTYTAAAGDAGSTVTLTMTVTSTNSCSPATATATFSVSVNALPTAVAGGSQTICVNGTATVSGATSSNGTIFWTDNGAGSITSGETTLTPTYTPAAGDAGNIVTLTMTVTSNNTCTPAIATTSYTITVNPLPTLASVSQAAQICSGAKATINLTGLIGTSSAVTYQIGTDAPVSKTGIGVSGGIANFLTDNLTAVNNGKTFTITNITNENTSCSATFSQNTILIVNSATIPTISVLSGNDPPCINSTVVYSTESGMTNYSWSVSGTPVTDYIQTLGGAGDNTVSVNWLTTGSRTVSVNYTNTNSCTAASPTVKNLTVFALPTPTISGPASACINTTGNVYSTQAGMSGYNWEITGGSITSGGDNNSFAVVTWSSAGPGTITVNYANASGCVASSPTNYAVIVHPLPVVTTPNTASTCSNTSPAISLTASEASSFTWTVGAISGSISGATSGSGNTINQVLSNASSSSAGTVQYLVTPTSTTGSCAGSPYSIVVTVYPCPVVTNSSTTTICSGTSPNITLTSSVPGSFAWTIGTITGGITGSSAGFGNTINQVLTNPGNSTSGTVQYLIIPTSTTGTCTGTTYSIVVTVNPTPLVTTSATAITCSGTAPNIVLTASTPGTFSWTVGAITGSIGGASAGSGNTINQVLSNPSNTIAGTVEYLVTPVSITGSCAGVPYSIIVTVNPLPRPSLNGPLAVRISSTGNLYTTEAGMSNYIWTVSAGGNVTAGGTLGSSSVTVTWNTTGSQSVSVKYTNTNNCTAIAATTANVTVNALPSVSSVSISGTPAIGETLIGTYSYSDGGGGGTSISTFRWLRNGTAVSGAGLDTYLLTGDDHNKTISFEVTPKTSVGSPNTGTPVVSSSTIPVENLSEIPVADQVCIEGVRTAGNSLRGKYRFTHSKPEGVSTYKWYINGVAIPSATGTQYTLLASDIDNDEDITFEVTPVSSNVVPVTGVTANSNPMARMPLVPTDYSVAVSSVPLTASPTGGIFSGPGVTNGIFSPSDVGVAGSPYSIQYVLNIVNSSTSCSQTVWKTVNVVTNTTEFTSFKDVYCQTEDPDEIVVSGLLVGSTSVGFHMTDPDAIVSSTDWTVTIDPKKMRPGNNVDYLFFRYKDFRGYEYQISKSFVIDSVGTGLQIINLSNEYCAETPKINISVSGIYPSGGTGVWTSSILSDLTAATAAVNVSLVAPGPTNPISYRYTSPLGCNSIVLNRNVTINPLPNPSFSIAPFYNIDGEAATLVPVQPLGTFSGNGVSGDKLYPDIAGLGEHTINYFIRDGKGCVDDLDIKTTIKKAQGTFTDIPDIICYRDTTFNVKVSGLPAGMTVNSFVNSRNSIYHIAGATDANYSVKAAGHGLDTLTLSYKLDGVDYWISKVVNIDSLGLVQIQNLLPGDKVCDNRAPYELFTSMPGGVFTGPVAGNYLDPAKATGLTSVSYKFTNSRTGCSTSALVPFSIIPAPQVSFLPKDVCIESNKDSTYFMNLTVSSDPVFEWTWTFAEVGAAPSNRKEPAFLYKNGGIHAVSLNVRTVSGCTVTKTSNIDLGIRPIADFTWQNDCFAPGAKLKLTDATFTNFPVISRTWNFNNGSLISSNLNPEYAMQDTGYVQVKYIVRTSYANCADTVSRRIYLRPTITIPKDGFYYQNFETGKAGWGKDDSDPSLIWSFGTPDRTRINKAKSGASAWYTRYESDKQGKIDTTSVISPCFDFTNIQRPMITLQAFKIFEKNRNGAALQYKTEGSDWKYVGTLDDGINWYNSTLINGKPGGEKIGWTSLSEEDADVDYVQSSHALDELKGKKNVKFRLAYGSDGNSLDKEGIAFDDIWIGERTRKVLLEHFTNTFSKKGSEATTFVNKITKGKENDIINIQYHTNFPDDDPFYLVNPGDASARIFSYGLSKVPYSLIDGGYNGNLYASLSDYKTTPLDSNDLSRRILLDSKFAISLTPKVTGGVLTVNSTVTAVDGFASDNLVLYLVVTEKEAISDKPAALGEVIFKNVFRKFIPDAGGIDLRKTWIKGDSFIIPEKTWVIENIKNNTDIEVVAFIQNSQTKEVYQVASGSLKTGKSFFDNSKLDENAIGTENELLPAIITFGLYPNPASDKLRIDFSDKLGSETDIRIFDFQGALKKSYKVASGESELFIEDLGLKAGIYLVRISSGGADLGFRKLIITGN